MIFEYKLEKIIEKLTRVLSLDVKYFFKNGIWIFIRYIVIGLSGLIITISFARLGTKQMLGQYQFVLNFLAMLSVFSLPGLNTVALRGVASGKDGIIKKVFNKSFSWSLFAIPIIICYGIYQIFYSDELVGKTIILAGFLFPFFYASNTWYAFFEGKTLFKSASLRIILSNIVLALSIATVLYFKVNIFWIIFFYLFANILMNGIFYLEVFKKAREASEKIDMKYGLTCTLQKFTYSFSESIPVLVISFIFGFELLAVYQVAYFLIALVIGFVSALSAMYMPLLFKYNRINHFKIIWQNLLIGLIFFIVFVIFIKLFFFIFYGENYRESYNLVRIFSFAVILIPLKVYLFNFFMAKNKNKFLIISNLFSSILALIVFYVIRSCGFLVSIPIYFYLFSLLVGIPLLINYFLIASRKTDSILSEIN